MVAAAATAASTSKYTLIREEWSEGEYRFRSTAGGHFLAHDTMMRGNYLPCNAR